jgi:hypothetical protein
LPRFFRYNSDEGMALKKAADEVWQATAPTRA